MSRYIEANKKLTITVYDDEHEEHVDHYMTIEEILDTYTSEGCPPTADVVEVVRCKDCKHAEIQDYAPPSCRYCCKYSALYHAKNFYCSMGERREDERLNKQTGCD